jgi:hypothetical protein
MVGLSRSFVFLSLVLAVALFVAVNDAVDRSKFRTCDSTSFCRRHRELTRWATFRVNPSTIAASSTGMPRLVGGGAKCLYLTKRLDFRTYCRGDSH